MICLTPGGQLCAREQPRAVAQTPLVILPIEFENNRIRMTAHLEGVPLLLLLDSGSSTTVLFSNMAKVIQDLPVIGETSVVFPALDQTFIGLRIAPAKLDFAQHEITLTNIIQLTDKNDLKARLLLRYDGILGREFFRKYTVEVDPTAQELRLYEQGTNLGLQYRTRHQLFMEDGAPHVRFRTKMPWETSPSMKQMLVDTGYPGAIVFWDSLHYRKAAKLTPSLAQMPEQTAIVGRASFKFGRLNFMHTPVFLGSYPPKQVGKRDGLIGASILNNFSYAIDLTGGQMWMLSKHEGSDYSRQIDGTLYSPNDEEFVMSDFAERLSAVPKLIIDFQ